MNLSENVLSLGQKTVERDGEQDMPWFPVRGEDQQMQGSP